MIWRSCVSRHCATDCCAAAAVPPLTASAATANAAAMLSLEDELGTLTPGRVADVSVLNLDEGDWTLQDSLGVRIAATKRLRPVLALRAGKPHRPDSPLLVEAVPEVA